MFGRRPVARAVPAVGCLMETRASILRRKGVNIIARFTRIVLVPIGHYRVSQFAVSRYAKFFINPGQEADYAGIKSSPAEYFSSPNPVFSPILVERNQDSFSPKKAFS